MNKLEKVLLYLWIVSTVAIFVSSLLKLNNISYTPLMWFGVGGLFSVSIALIIDIFKNNHTERYTWLLFFLVLPGIAPLVYLIKSANQKNSNQFTN